MPFIRPTLNTLIDQTQQDIRAAVLRYLPKSVLGVLGKAIAGMSYTHAQYLDWISKQATVFTADSEYLEAWAALKGLFRKDASAAFGSVSFTGIAGTVVPSGTQVARGDGVTYSTQILYIVGTTIAVPVIADVPGVAGDADISTSLTVTTAIAGLSSTVTATQAMTGGAEPESDDDLRTRALFEFQRLPSGFSASDAVSFALQVPGVTRAWVNGSGAGPGTVVLFVMRDVSNTATNGFLIGTDGAATEETRWRVTAVGDQLAVAEYLYPLRSVTSIVVVVAPKPQPINVAIVGLSVNAATQTAISQALAALYLSVGTPLGMTIYPSQITAAIQAQVPNQSFTASPTAPVTVPLGYLPTVGTVTYS